MFSSPLDSYDEEHYEDAGDWFAAELRLNKKHELEYNTQEARDELFRDMPASRDESKNLPAPLDAEEDTNDDDLLPTSTASLEQPQEKHGSRVHSEREESDEEDADADGDFDDGDNIPFMIPSAPSTTSTTSTDVAKLDEPPARDSDEEAVEQTLQTSKSSVDEAQSDSAVSYAPRPPSMEIPRRLASPGALRDSPASDEQYTSPGSDIVRLQESASKNVTGDAVKSTAESDQFDNAGEHDTPTKATSNATKNSVQDEPGADSAVTAELQATRSYVDTTELQNTDEDDRAQVSQETAYAPGELRTDPSLDVPFDNIDPDVFDLDQLTAIDWSNIDLSKLLEENDNDAGITLPAPTGATSSMSAADYGPLQPEAARDDVFVPPPSSASLLRLSRE
ncbi:hypothetical protein BD626DRAFT_575680 [Schizophyllum amplum]|uniref:Uncharacterized protein n=1 Tax=Schizophyllum amplum TaxID=97359 RepID=A0A550BVA2_9AGAR|nr:hypothetical protein BD626DRAFT_575680 [Auriculariopsis ampla]